MPGGGQVRSLSPVAEDGGCEDDDMVCSRHDQADGDDMQRLPTVAIGNYDSGIEDAVTQKSSTEYDGCDNLSFEQVALVRGMALVWRARAEKRKRSLERHRSGHLAKTKHEEEPAHTAQLSQMPEAVQLQREVSMAGAKLYNKRSLRLGKKLGEGFFGEAYLAEGLNGETVVVKVFKQQEDDPEAQNRFLAEMDFHRALFHTNIVEFKGVFWDHGRLNLVTEYIPGGTLLRLVKSGDITSLPWLRRIAMALDISEAMVYLHSLGIVHRDLKSDNCLLRVDGSVVVIDFGLSRRLMRQKAEEAANEVRSRYAAVLHELLEHHRPAASAEPVRLQSQLPSPMTPESGEGCLHDVASTCQKYSAKIGTAYYMAPELFENDPSYNELVDVFSFGLICAEIATGMEADPEPDVGRGLPRTVLKVTGSFAFGLDTKALQPVCAEMGCSDRFFRLIVACCSIAQDQRPTFRQASHVLRSIRSQIEGEDG
eukprot:m.42094 g.42094  ORF g.42094 m.42094 type:complete len:482 (+) comp11513_c0_seq2:321-1766(+)